MQNFYCGCEALMRTSKKSRNTIYRVYTADVARADIIRKTAQRFDSFTIHEASGHFKGKEEAVLIIELIDAQEADVKELARVIRRAHRQKSVLVLKIIGEATRVK
jgi:hypothetical protein